MKKLFEISIAALALILLSAACAKVNPVDETPVSKTVTIRATISDAATRVTFDPSFDGNSNPTAMAHTWQAGDKLRITDASDATKTALFDLVEGEGTATGTFRGEGFEAASYNVEAVPQGSFSNGFTQTQAKDGATDHLQFVATATETGPAGFPGRRRNRGQSLPDRHRPAAGQHPQSRNSGQ